MIISASTDSLSIAPTWERADVGILHQLAEFPVALIGDAQDRMGIMNSSIRAVTPGLRLVGTILPIQTREGDNLAIHRALDDARPEDVLVINANSDTNRACFGDILGELCLSRKVAGVIIDGATRDIEELAELGLPTFARGVSPAGPFKHGPGAVGFPVACGNVVCNPGDIVIGDDDGIVVVPRHLGADALELTRRQASAEDRMRSLI